VTAVVSEVVATVRVLVPALVGLTTPSSSTVTAALAARVEPPNSPQLTVVPDETLQFAGWWRYR
jgi:hypothetical protein